MNSTAWKGLAAGLAVFLVVAAVALLTPARAPVLKAVGRDHAALRLESRIIATLPAETPAAELAARRRSLDNRFEAWDRRNARLSAFGLLGAVIELWPWLFGLGFALPVLGALVGMQVGSQGASHAGGSAARSGRAASPSSPAHAARLADKLPEDPPRPATSAPPVAPPQDSPPPPPETWNWNATPTARVAPARPRPPAVESPHGNSGNSADAR